jgi:hypothetical protein
LRDQKGTLEVLWRVCPTFSQVMAVGRAWVRVGNECLTVHHMTDGRPLAEQDGDRWTFDDEAVRLMLRSEAHEAAVSGVEDFAISPAM